MGLKELIEGHRDSIPDVYLEEVVCPSCRRRPVAIVDDVFATEQKPNPIVECRTIGCPDVGKRWRVSDLLRLAEEGTVEEPTDRPSWDDYFLGLAREVSTRATCDRSKVGCVLVVGRDIVATGYNGSLSGAPHCDDVGHRMVEGKCTRTVHAEANAIARAAKRGTATDGATAYVTRLPCEVCCKLLISAGVKRIVVFEVLKPQYIEEARWWAREGGVELVLPGDVT